MIALVEQPIAMAIVIAFSKEARVRMVEGRRSSLTILTIRRPDAAHIRMWLASAAGMDVAPGRVSPSASVLAVIVLFALVVQRAFAIGRQSLLLERAYGGLVAQGIGIWIGVQAFINMGVNMGLLPTKGLTLPLMSFGGSGILANCVALAILLRVDYENRALMRGAAA